MADSELLAEIRQVLADSPFVGEGHRKLWARLRRRGVGTSRKRVLRLCREAGLLAPTARVRRRARRLHEGTITVTEPDTLWATDATEGWTDRDGRCAIFCVVDHATERPSSTPRLGWIASPPPTCCARRARSASARWSAPSPAVSRCATTAARAFAPITTRPRSITSGSLATGSGQGSLDELGDS